MPQFTYKAYTREGEVTQGTLAAQSTAEAVQILAKRGWVPSKLEVPRGWIPRWSRVPLADQVAWFGMFADLIASGMTIASSLELLQDRTTNRSMSEATRDLKSRILQGESLSDAMRYHSKVFDSLTQHLVAAGEEGNFLELVLEKIASIKEAKSKLGNRLTSALAYPFFLLVVGGLVFAGMMLFFVPKFEPLFERMRATEGLPWATEALFSINKLVSQNGLLVFIGLTAIATAMAYWICDPKNRLFIDRALYCNRVLGPLVSGIAIARFCQILGGLLSSGVRIQVATILAGQSTNNRLLESAAERAVERITAGASLADGLEEQKIFPREILEVIRMGERTNRLEKVLESTARRMESKIERRLDLVLRMLEPALMVVMASVIGFIMIALLAPIFNASSQSFQ